MFCFNITCTGQVFIKKFEANTCNINISVLAAKKILEVHHLIPAFNITVI